MGEEKEMIINKRKWKMAVTDILLLVCAVLYFIGIKYWFPVCAVSGEMVMSCHWAGEVLTALSVLLIVTAAVHMVIPDEKIKTGMDIALVGIAVLAAMIPGNIISLCKNSEMQCRSNTSVWTMILMISFCLIACADGFIYLQLLSGEKHKRKASEKSV